MSTNIPVLTEEQVEWVVNDLGELGVKIGEQFFFLYKGHSLSYGKGATNEFCSHNNGENMHWRPVGKREFGECCHPINYEDLDECGHSHRQGTVSLSDSDKWKALPTAKDKPEDKSSSVAIPEGWVALTMTWEEGHPKDIAFGTEVMMNRLKKWMEKYFSMLPLSFQVSSVQSETKEKK